MTSNSPDKTRIRNSIKDLFPNRTCFSLPRPAEDESTLTQMFAHDVKKMRPVFLKKLQQLKQYILTNTPLKTANNRPIDGFSRFFCITILIFCFFSGRVLSQLAQLYVKSMNEGKAPVIRDTWSMVISALDFSRVLNMRFSKIISELGFSRVLNMRFSKIILALSLLDIF
jgi:hypothetical protein